MIALILAASLLTFQDRTDPAAELAAVRQLYSAASFDEALSRLSRVKATDALQDQVDTYRALCLLALGRSREAETTVEQLIRRNPKYLPDEANVSPKFVQTFRTVRARLLPDIATNLYNGARKTYDSGNFDLATAQFRELVTLIGNSTDSKLIDLRMLADGFLRLADSARATGALPPRTDAAGTGAPVYSMLDRDVVGPVEINRVVPTMITPRGVQPRLYQGLIEVIIDERGRVESAVIRRSIGDPFDAELMAAASNWRFQPATRNATPVKYRRAYEIIGHSR